MQAEAAALQQSLSAAIAAQESLEERVRRGRFHLIQEELEVARAKMELRLSEEVEWQLKKLRSQEAEAREKWIAGVLAAVAVRCGADVSAAVAEQAGVLPGAPAVVAVNYSSGQGSGSVQAATTQVAGNSRSSTAEDVLAEEDTLCSVPDTPAEHAAAEGQQEGVLPRGDEVAEEHIDGSGRHRDERDT